MNLPEALKECADMLTLAGTALKGIVISTAQADEPDVLVCAEKVLDIAMQLQRLGAELEAIAGAKSALPH